MVYNKYLSLFLYGDDIRIIGGGAKDQSEYHAYADCDED